MVDPRLSRPVRPPMNEAQHPRPREPIINAEVVKMRRKQLGYSQAQLAIMSACNIATIRKIERGIQMDPSTSVTLRIAKSLAVTVEALCRGARPYAGRHSSVGNKHIYDPDWTPTEAD